MKHHSKFEILDQISQLEGNLHMLADTKKTGKYRGLIVAGPGGTGKTHNVLSVLKELKTPFEHIKGYNSELALIEKLRTDPSGLFIFDDCDSVLYKSSENVLKSALDENHSVVEHANRDEVIRVRFTGRIILITNREPANISQPIRSRCHLVYLSFSRDELLDYVEHLIGIDALKHKLSKPRKLELLEWYRENDTLNGCHSIRTFLKLCDRRFSSEENWEANCRYTLAHEV